jgi:hypothetical protein
MQEHPRIMMIQAIIMMKMKSGITHQKPAYPYSHPNIGFTSFPFDLIDGKRAEKDTLCGILIEMRP